MEEVFRDFPDRIFTSGPLIPFSSYLNLSGSTF